MKYIFGYRIINYFAKNRKLCFVRFLLPVLARKKKKLALVFKITPDYIKTIFHIFNKEGNIKLGHIKLKNIKWLNITYLVSVLHDFLRR